MRNILNRKKITNLNTILMAYTVYLCSVGKTAVHLGIVLELFIND